MNGCIFCGQPVELEQLVCCAEHGEEMRQKLRRNFIEEISDDLTWRNNVTKVEHDLSGEVVYYSNQKRKERNG